MGCDIHAVVEAKLPYNLEREEKEDTFLHWHNIGDPGIGRNYEVFAVLGNVRNEEEIPFIAERRFPESAKDIEASDEFLALYEQWSGDAHSASWVTLKEMKDFNAEQTIYSHRLVSSRDEQGNITSTCGGSNRENLPEVGDTNIFGPWGHGYWDSIISRIEKLATTWGITDPERVRVAFFFDN
jgi:hypothetical protein